MARWLLLPIALCLALWLLVTARRLWREARRGRAERAAALGEIASLLEAPRVRVQPSGFPRLAGGFEGREVDFQLVPDTLTFRKLPALWLLVTLVEPQPLAGETRIMRRPSGLEPFTRFGALLSETAPPPEFPEDCVVRATAPGHLPPPALLAGLAPLFADPRLKEVVLAPEGLRLVRLVEEAPRTAYLLFRESELGRTPVPAAVARPMLEALLALAGEIARARGSDAGYDTGARHA